MGRAHIELTIRTGAAAFDTIAGALRLQGFEGFWEEENVLRAYIREDLWSAQSLEPLSAALTRITADLLLPPPSLAISPIAEQNWNSSWEETIRPIRVSERIVVAPTWHPFTGGPGEIVLTIDPKMSFGTGYHESTRLLLALMERHLTTGARVLDAGTGTGILAIAALKLGASSAVAFDIDEWSFANAVDNARLNGVAGRVTIRLGDLGAVPETEFDLIVANIQKNVIEEMLPGLVLRLSASGTVLLSGLLAEDRAAMASPLAGAGLAITDERREGEWIALAAARA